VTVEVHRTVLGGPAAVIEHIAQEASADLIVIATRGRSPVAGLLLGGVAQPLLHIAARPVLAVPPPDQ
jgi:nucleotide-binding universal stress UspA family protein